MSDRDVRELGRRASHNPEEEARALAARWRAGQHQRGDLELAAWLGHEPARIVLGDSWAPPEPGWHENGYRVRDYRSLDEGALPDYPLEFWLYDAAAYAGLRGKDDGGWTGVYQEDARTETFHLTALLCVTGYWLARTAIIAPLIDPTRNPDALFGGLRPSSEEAIDDGTVTIWKTSFVHEDPPGTRASVDLVPPQGVTMVEHLSSCGLLDDVALRGIEDVHNSAIRALRPDRDYTQRWAWALPDGWFAHDQIVVEGEPYTSMLALCTCGHHYQDHERNEVEDDVCSECSCIRFEASGASACGTFPQPAIDEFNSEQAAAYFCADIANNVICASTPVRLRLRNNLCFWAVGSTPMQTSASPQG